MTMPLHLQEVLYAGELNGNREAVVFRLRDGKKYPLPPRLDLANHSPTGFQWGYTGSGPAQLALSILADFLKDSAAALTFYQKFKFDVIAHLPMNEPWTLTHEQVRSWLREGATA